jgi:hypothetical protein
MSDQLHSQMLLFQNINEEASQASVWEVLSDLYQVT